MSGAIDINVMWVLLCSFLVAVMQAGFTCLESGFVRSKNSINVAVKNLVDFCLSSALFTIFGYSIMFGDSMNGLIGNFKIFDISTNSTGEITYYIFQLMFAGTAATIISGAVAERMKFSGYIVITVLISIIVYPVCGHWAWNSANDVSGGGWLNNLGFIDFAGSTVVHSVAGWCALAAIIIIGPRIGRYGKGAKNLEGHNLPIAVLGVFLLWFGWFGFNGGSTIALNDKVPMIIANTILSGATGGISAIALSWYFNKMPRVEHLINGTIAGLVAICAGCDLFTEVPALLVGLIAGVICVLTMKLLDKFLIDDVIGAVPAHLAAGIWGTLAVALFAPTESFSIASNRFEQFGIQLIGITAIGIYSFSLIYLIIFFLNKKFSFRVSEEAERIGLNISEHGATTSLLDLISQMDLQARTGDFSRSVDIEPETEAGHIATFYNSVLEKFNIESERRQKAMDELYLMANYDALTNLVNRRYFYDLTGKAIRRAKRSNNKLAVLFLDLDGFKMVNDTLGHEAGDELLIKVGERCIDIVRETDIVGRIGGDEFCILLENFDSEKDCESIAKKIIKSLSTTFKLKAARANIGVSIGIAVYDPQTDAEVTDDDLITMADKAMYNIKTKGKGDFAFYQRSNNINISN